MVDSALRRDVQALVRLATPVTLGQLASMAMWMVDLLMLGQVSVHAVASTGLARGWMIAGIIIGLGMTMGMDPLVSQAHGARDRHTLSLVLQQGLVISVAVAIPIGLLWLWTQPILVTLGQEPHLARTAHLYTVLQLPGLPFFFGFIALRQWLQGRSLMRPAMWIAVAANGINVVANWLLIFGNLGFPAMGVAGASLSTTLTQIFLFVGLAVIIVRRRLQRGAWTGWSRNAFDLTGLRRIASFGTPIAAQLGLEMWAFILSTFLAGLLGETSLATHTIVLNFSALAFMMPLGLSMGAVTRVGNLLGRGDPARAQQAAWIALGLSSCVMLGWMVVFLTWRTPLSALFTNDPAVLALSAAVLPVMAASQVFDGAQVVGGGVLRGMGRPRPAAVFNFFGHYLIGLPLGYLLAFGLLPGWGNAAGLGLQGLWWGLCAGLGAVAIALVWWIHRRGPATVTAIVRRRRSGKPRIR